MLTKKIIGETIKKSFNREMETKMSIYKTRIAPRLEMISAHLSAGGSIAELAEKLGVTLSELEKCIHSCRTLAAIVENAIAIRRNKDDCAVENALFQRAVGFEQPDGKFSPPDVRAAMFWLKNRRPQQWDEKNRNSGSGVIELSELEEEL